MYFFFFLYCIGCFYFTLGNLHPRFRSTLKAIQLIALVKTTHIKKYGVDAVLEVIVDDIEHIEKVWLLTRH